MRAVPTLFNLWPDGLYPAGGVHLDFLIGCDWGLFRDYVGELLGRWGDDDRILAWDICNEPWVFSLDDPIQKLQHDFVRAMADHARSLSPRQPITIGTTAGDNIRWFADLVDVISFHPYADTPDEMASMCDAALAIAGESGKPLVATETVKGSLDDERHVEMAMWSVEALESRGIGWLLWQLVAGPMVAARRDWFHANTPPGDSGYMPFALPDGSLRPGHQRLADWLATRR
jgi:hypothetical protein